MRLKIRKVAENATSNTYKKFPLCKVNLNDFYTVNHFRKT